MNRLLALILVCLTVSFSHAQRAKVITAATVFADGDIKEAKNYIDQAFSSPEVSEMAKAWITKAEIYSDISRFNMAEELGVSNPLVEAEAAFRKAFELDMAAEKKQGRYLDRIQTGMYNTAIGLFKFGEADFNEQKFEEALQTFDMIVNVISFLETNDLVTEGDENPAIVKRDGYLNAALCALKVKDNDKAAEYYNIMINEGIATEMVYANLASILISNSEFEKALPIISTGREKFPDNESLGESELNYFIGTDQSEMAVDKLKTAIEADESNSDLHFNLALAYDKLDEQEKMEETYKHIIKMDPNYFNALLNLGAYYNEKANNVIKLMNAEPNWQEAIKMEPDRNKWYNLALPNLEKAYELHPEKEEVRRALERIYANLDMLDKIEDLKNDNSQVEE